jgi:hypothetical protein
MPSKRVPKSIRRHNKKIERLYSNQPFKEENQKFSSLNSPDLESGNELSSLKDQDIKTINDVISERYSSAEIKTDEISGKMNNWEKQYKGEWQNNSSQDDIFLRKTKEQVRVVYSHITEVINSLSPLVTYRPIVSSVEAARKELERSKIAEALVDYTLNDLLRFKEDILPQFLKSFLKYSMGVLKLSYEEDESGPDFRLENIDRGNLYIDPHAKHDIKNASWVIEKYGLSKRAVLKKIDDGLWSLPSGVTRDDILELSAFNASNNSLNSIERMYEDSMSNFSAIEEDEAVEVWDYWQSPTEGLSDAYAVIIGGADGIMVRYGPNPYPYKNHPYFAKSYDPHEYEVDGEGLVQEMEGIQRVVNTFLNLRLDDVRQNINQRVAVVGDLIDETTMKDFGNNQKFVRLNEEAVRAKGENYDVKKDFFTLPVTTSTGELQNDLAFYLAQWKENTGISDAMSGNAMPRQVTATQFNQTLSRSVGTQRPVLLQVASLIEEVADAMLMYFKDEDFFGENKIIQVVGKNKYADCVTNWHSLPGGLNIRDVSPDDIDVEGTMTAVNGFEDQINKQMSLNSIINMIQAVSVNPDMYQDARKDINFGAVTRSMFNNSGVRDVDEFLYSEEEKQENARQEQIQQQQALQQQMQLQQLQLQGQAELEESKQQSMAEAKIAVDQAKAFSDTNKELTVDTQRILNSMDADITKNNAFEAVKLKSNIASMREEARLEKQSPDISVGHGNDVKKQ